MIGANVNPRYIADMGIVKTCEHTQVQQVGIDLTLKELVEVRHGHSVNVLMNEEIKLPKNMFALLIHRSSFNRKGIIITGSVYDPGYKGVIGCTIYNLSGEVIQIPANKRICQIVCYHAEAASEYDGQWQNEHLEEDKKC